MTAERRVSRLLDFTDRSPKGSPLMKKLLNPAARAVRWNISTPAALYSGEGAVNFQDTKGRGDDEEGNGVVGSPGNDRPRERAGGPSARAVRWRHRCATDRERRRRGESGRHVSQREAERRAGRGAGGTVEDRGPESRRVQRRPHPGSRTRPAARLGQFDRPERESEGLRDA